LIHVNDTPIHVTIGHRGMQGTIAGLLVELSKGRP